MQRRRAAVGELPAFFRRCRAPGPRNCYSISESCSLRAGCFKRLPRVAETLCSIYLTCMSMVRTTVYLDQEIALALRQLAARQGRSQAELIRDALASYVRTKRPAAFGAHPTLRRIYVLGSICESDTKTCENSTASGEERGHCSSARSRGVSGVSTACLKRPVLLCGDQIRKLYRRGPGAHGPLAQAWRTHSCVPRRD